MDIGEAVAVEMPGDDHNDSCYFCSSKEDEPTTEANDLKDDPDEDKADMSNSLGEYKFKNSARKLGRALGGKPGAKEISFNGKTYKAAVAAHHLIPGNASLANSKIGKYLGIDGKKKGNIGYNVNSSPNGIWSPGNYGVRPWGTGGSEFAKSGITPQTFAFKAMEEWQCQFHDAHKDYSDFVITLLDKIHDSLNVQEEVWCPKQKKKDDDDVPQLFQIVSRLNTVSLRMRRMLIYPTSNWKSNIWTSRFAKAYMSGPHKD